MAPARSLARYRRAAAVLIGLAVVFAPLASPVAAAAAQQTPLHGLGLLPTPGLQSGVSATAINLVQSVTALPSSVDLSAWDPPVGNQGAVSSCASWATGYYYRYWLRNRISGETSTFAPMFLYSQVTHGVDTGSSFGGNISLMESEGIPHEADYSQGFFDYTTGPTAAELKAAAPYKVSSGSMLFFGVGIGNQTQITVESSLAAGRPVILAIPIYGNFDSAGPASYLVDVPSAGMTSRGGHGVFVSKYDSKGVWIENSWGTGWGKAGWAELSWAFVNQYSNEGWTMAADNDVALAVSGFANPSIAGAAQGFRVMAKDGNSVTATGYRGTIHFTSTDPAAVLPADYTFTAGDAGVHAFSVTFKTAGAQSVTATDKAASSITGTRNGVIQAPGATYHALAPARVLDTRVVGGVNTNPSGTGKLIAGSVRTFAVAGAHYIGGGTKVAVPTGATAVTGNLTVVNGTATGVVALGPTETVGGDVSTISFVRGDIRATGVTMGLGPGGTLQAVFRSATAGASVDVIFDVTGFFTPDTSGATYHAVTPGRVLDSRPTTSGHTNIGVAGKFANRVVRNFKVAGVKALGWASALVPVGATAVTGNLTVTNATSRGYVALGPTMTATPSTSTLNVTAGANRANGVTVTITKAGTLGAVWCGTVGSSADLIFDVTGYFTADATGLSYHPITPVRVLDSSINRGLTGASATGKPRTLAVGGVGQIPSDAAGISGDLIIVRPTSMGWAFISPAPVAAPTSSSVNTNSGVNCANGLDVPLSSRQVALIWVGAAGSQTYLQLDVTGYWR